MSRQDAQVEVDTALSSAYEAYTSYEGYKSGVVSVIGRPSAGKSTLLNELCGYKVSIVASSPQTTRNTIRAIVQDDRGQMVLLDTPGYHKSEKAFNLRLSELAREALDQADVVLYVIDSSRPVGEEEEAIAALIRPLAHKTLVVLSKMDHPDSQKSAFDAFIASISPAKVLYTSVPMRSKKKKSSQVQTLAAAEARAEARDYAQDSAQEHTRTEADADARIQGVEKLKTALFDLLPEGEPLYPEDVYTDQDPEFRISEIIREQTINRLAQEIPHGIYVGIEDLEVRQGGEQLWIRALIYCEKESQKGIIVGKGGKGIRDIRVGSQKAIKSVFFYPRIHLDVQVRCDKSWRTRSKLLNRMIH